MPVDHLQATGSPPKRYAFVPALAASPSSEVTRLNVTERVTLITGASTGIGAELARVFASHGHRVALVARRADRLAALAGEIASAGGSKPIVIPCDLEQPDAGDKIAAALAGEGVEVEYVVNNAGFGLFGNAIELDRAEQLNIIAVNIRSEEHTSELQSLV